MTRQNPWSSYLFDFVVDVAYSEVMSNLVELYELTPLWVSSSITDLCDEEWSELSATDQQRLVDAVQDTIREDLDQQQEDRLQRSWEYSLISARP